MNCITKIQGRVQTAALDIDGVEMPAALMPYTGTASRAERAFKSVSRCGLTRPVMWRALKQAQGTPCYRERHSEGGSRLLSTLRAVAYVNHQRLFRHGITYAAALAAARLLAGIQGNGLSHES